MPKSNNALAPEVTGVNRLVDWAVQKLDPSWFPTAGRTFVETAQGARAPITEANFSPAELKALRQLVQYKGGDSGAINNYSDYAKSVEKATGDTDVAYSPGIFSLGDPLGNIQTTLGRFKYARDPNGDLIVVDTYDFNPIYGYGRSQEATTGGYGLLSPYALLRNYAGEKMPPGQGRDIRINLGK